MKPKLYKKSIVFAILVVLIGAAAIPSISGNDLTKSNNIVKPQPAPESLFFDDFNDNTKDMTKWTEEFTDGSWWEDNQQAEFRIYEPGGGWDFEGITSIGIPVSLDEPLVIECIMDTYINSNGGFVGQPHFKVVDANNEDNYIDVYYKRDINEIRVRDSDGPEIILGKNDEFRFEVTITIESDKYKVEVGPYTSGWQVNDFFPSEFSLKVKIYLAQAGDYPSIWWIAGFDDVAVNGKRRSKNAYNDIDIPRFLNNFPILQKLLMQLLGL
jgi:hypothetical protein